MEKKRLLRLLLWKNYILQIRRPFATAAELILPILFSAVLLGIRTAVDTYDHKTKLTFPNYTLDKMPEFQGSIVPADNTWVVAYVPSGNAFLKDVMETVQTKINVPHLTTAEEACNFDRNQMIEDLDKPSYMAHLPKVEPITKCVLALNPDSPINKIMAEKKKTKAETLSLDQMRVDAIRFLRTLPSIPKIKVKAFAREKDFVKFADSEENEQQVLCGVMFSGDLIDDPTNGEELKMVMRFNADPINIDPTEDDRFSAVRNTWRTARLFPSVVGNFPRNNITNTTSKPKYFGEGFLTVLHNIDMTVTEKIKGQSVPSYLEMQRFPHPPYTQDRFMFAMRTSLPLVIMLSYFYTTCVIIKSIVAEKESRMKEYMKMMGVPKRLHWLAWYIKCMVFLSVSCFFITVILKVKVNGYGVLPNSDPTVIFLFLILFSSATVSLSFLISVFFNKANVAAACGGVIYALTYTPFFFLISRIDQLASLPQYFFGLLSNMAMSFGCNIIGIFEARGKGVQWSNLGLSPSLQNDVTMVDILILLLFNSVIYLILTVYIEATHPGEFGTPLPWYFPFVWSWWRHGTIGKDDHLNLDQASQSSMGDSKEEELFEAEPTSLRTCVQVSNLKKFYTYNGQVKKAVNGLTMNMYEGEIFVLLGHNGAGKTTTMSMLTGFTPPTSGEAVVNGCSIKHDIDGVRQEMGLCPQFNILFDALTVDEHLYFFARLKGITSRERIERESTRMLEDLKLEDKRDELSQNLSGGMKRKLSVGIAFSASSRYVILDEPTSGMDPAARRAIWDVLKKYRGRSSILLSTHFMDEADYLANRIAIMASGKLRCSGSPHFLKNKFGVGYHVVLTRSEQSNQSDLEELFKKHVGSKAMVERTDGAEISFRVPFNSSDKFPDLFRDLDEKAEALGVSGYGATITTMEEVFLRVTEWGDNSLSDIRRTFSQKLSSAVNLSFQSDSKGEPATGGGEVEGEEGEEPSDGSFEMKNLANKRRKNSVFGKEIVLNTGFTLYMQQFYAIFMKHLLHASRNKKMAVAQSLVPVIFIFLAIINAKNPTLNAPNEELAFTLNDYPEKQIVFYTVDEMSSAPVKELADVYVNQFSDKIEMKKTDDIVREVVEEQEEEFGDFHFYHVIATRFMDGPGEIMARAMYNDEAFHSSALALMYTDQAFMRHQLGKPNFKLRVSNYPLPRKAQGRLDEEIFGSINGFFIAFNVVLGFAFLNSSFVVLYTKERCDRSALLQRLTGVNLAFIWLPAFLWDFINFLIPSLIVLAMFAIADVEEYNDHFALLLVVFLFYIWASLPLNYVASFFFNSSSTALVRMTIFNVITGLAPLMVVNVFVLLEIDPTAPSYFFYLLPQFCLGQAFNNVYANFRISRACTKSAFTRKMCADQDIAYQENFYAVADPGVGKSLVYCSSCGLFFWVLLLCLEYQVFSLMTVNIRQAMATSRMSVGAKESRHDDEHEMGDVDVVEERRRIMSAQEEPSKNEVLRVENLTKVYERGKRGKLVAVDGICFSVQRSECFGLLGINGAGKTTTFKMLCGDHQPTRGTAKLNGYDLVHQLHEVQQRLGYCPQFDAFIDQLTGEEMLTLYARLRGVPKREMKGRVLALARVLNFADHMYKPCGSYSGGNKRKLSTAIAIIGAPPVVLLDEPSTGMDPGARRMMWDVVQDIRLAGKSIVFTSHSMEECEALCTRLAIMVNGRLKCIGNPQHLKSRFGQGYNLEISTVGMEERSKEIRQAVLNHFTGSKGGYEGAHSSIIFSISSLDEEGNRRGLAEIFEAMEQLKKDHRLEHYTLTQTTLEQVFINLVKKQREDDKDTHP